MPTYDKNGALLINIGAGAAPTNAQYVVMALDATLTAERVLTGTANQIVVTDGGAGGPATLSTPQDIAPASGVTFGTVTVPNAGWVGAGVGCAWLYDSATPDISTAVNVGIGDPAPGYDLVVNSGTTNDAARFISTDAGLYILLKDSGTSGNGMRIGVVGDSFRIFATGAAALVTVLDGGDVGFGTTAPGSLQEWNFADDDLEFVDAHAATGLGSVSGVVEVQRAGVTGYIPIYDSYS